MLLVNSVVEFPLKDTKQSFLEYIAPPKYLAVLLIKCVVEFSSNDIQPYLEYIAPPSPIATLFLNNVIEFPSNDIWL